MQLRPYQQAAVDAVYEHLRSKETNPCVVIPCGCGKSLVLAQIAKDSVEKWNGRVLILAHVKELLEQNADLPGIENRHLFRRTQEPRYHGAGHCRRDSKRVQQGLRAGRL